jgi:ATP-GRASP peptide maturase of grasp-with-spasm system
MIALVSQVVGEGTTEMVMDWLQFLGADFVRLNGEGLNADDALEIRLGAGAGGGTLRVDVDGRTVEGDGARAVWLRRWHTMENLADLRRGQTDGLGHAVWGHLGRELVALRGGLEDGLRGASWLTRESGFGVNKLHVLRVAGEVGMDVPPTLVTNRRDTLAAFLREQGRVISKPMGEATDLQAGGASYVMFTAEVTPELVERLPERFFPSLFQSRIEKRYELRVFYLTGRCWSMAIFSQGDAQTAVDFRNYNLERPNRRVPYALPAAVEESVVALMRALELDTGSVDLIRAQDGRYVFLEVNPIGQFGMVSEPCNYFLERRVAEHLMELHDAA